MSRIDQIRQFLQDSPNDSFLRYALAQELQKQGDVEAAKEAYLWLTENQPSYVATYYHLGKLLIALGEKEAALAWFNLGIEHAKAAKELHALSELQSAKLELEYEDD
ncbi:MAG: tetratricopeptide repeat protein [Bacteroidetes bacterium]|nr:tetratricopeptide repeat protein [Bacteroidota bacterium]MDA1224972.1 tetratricopeptide repeat protein [Bacteroidota bacterium]